MAPEPSNTAPPIVSRPEGLPTTSSRHPSSGEGRAYGQRRVSPGSNAKPSAAARPRPADANGPKADVKGDPRATPGATGDKVSPSKGRPEAAATHKAPK